MIKGVVRPWSRRSSAVGELLHLFGIEFCVPLKHGRELDREPRRQCKTHRPNRHHRKQFHAKLLEKFRRRPIEPHRCTDLVDEAQFFVTSRQLLRKRAKIALGDNQPLLVADGPGGHHRARRHRRRLVPWQALCLLPQPVGFDPQRFAVARCRGVYREVGSDAGHEQRTPLLPTFHPRYRGYDQLRLRRQRNRSRLDLALATRRSSGSQQNRTVTPHAAKLPSIIASAVLFEEWRSVRVMRSDRAVAAKRDQEESHRPQSLRQNSKARRRGRRPAARTVFRRIGSSNDQNILTIRRLTESARIRESR